KCEQRRAQPQLCDCALADRERIGFRKNQFREHAYCAVVNVGRAARLDRGRSLRTRRTGQQYIEGKSWFVTDRSDSVAATHLTADNKIRQVNCGARARVRDFQIPTMALDRPNARGKISRLNDNILSALNLTAGQG